MESFNLRNRRRLFIWRHLVPIAAILGSSFGCLFGLLFHLTGIQDRMELQRESQLIAAAFGSTKRLTVNDLQDYAEWDDAVRHITYRLDPEWVDGNVSAYLVKAKRYAHVFAIDTHDRTVYEHSHGHRPANPTDARLVLGDGFAAGLRKLRGLRHSGQLIVGGYSRAGSKVFVYAAASVVPMSQRVSIGPGPTSVLVIATEVDKKYLAKMASSHQTPPLRLAPLSEEAPPGELNLLASAGKPIAHIDWSLDRPGSVLRRQILPGFLAVGLIALLAAGLILRRAWRDVGALQSSQLQMQHLANHDMLTGLPNRHAIMNRLSESMARGRVSLLFMDLDGFKDANDVYGHAIGDELLIEVASRICAAVGSAGFVGRVGGDEFAVILESCSATEVRRLAEQILEAIHAPAVIGGYSIAAGVSIGIAETAGMGSDDELVRRADVAMYAAKAGGKNGWCAYDPSLDHRFETRRWLEQDLRAAIEQDEVEVAFQAIVDAGSHRVTGVEALVRWTHPIHGPIAPDVFIPVAEETGLITELGQKVLVAACRAALDWDVTLSVNLSPAQFWDGALAERVRQALAETGFPPERLVLEITESYLLRRPEAAHRILTELRELGIRIVLDDFGSGYASIGYLRRLAFDGVKIDRSFVEQVVHSSTAAELARALIAVGRALDLDVTAEGIETEEQATFMSGAGCRSLQGWHFGHPAPADTIGRILAGDTPLLIEAVRAADELAAA